MTWPPGRRVALEAVVRRRIVRRRDHDAGVAVEVPDGEGEQGGRAVLLEQEDLETGGRQDAGAELGELRGMMPRVVGDHARSGRASVPSSRSHSRPGPGRSRPSSARSGRWCRPGTSCRGGRRCRTRARRRTHRRARPTRPVRCPRVSRARYSANGASVSHRRMFAAAAPDTWPDSPPRPAVPRPLRSDHTSSFPRCSGPASCNQQATPIRPRRDKASRVSEQALASHPSDGDGRLVVRRKP